jgi:hypothetical protein
MSFPLIAQRSSTGSTRRNSPGIVVAELACGLCGIRRFAIADHGAS